MPDVADTPVPAITGLSRMREYLVRSGRKRFRAATSSLRALPDFIVIGVHKGGTTSIFEYLCQHPQVLYDSTKEIHYFDGGKNPETNSYARGVGWYRTHFPLRASLRPDKITGEASPYYLFHPEVPERIVSLVPRVKLIAILRNPVDRAISHYYHTRRKNREPLTLADAIRQEESRVNNLPRVGDFKNPALSHFTYKARGRYAEQLARYHRVFDRSQILVLKSEDLFTDPHALLRELFGFVGIDPDFRVPDLEPRNVGTRDPNIDPAVIEELTEYFRPHNQALYDLLGRDLGW